MFVVLGVLVDLYALTPWCFGIICCVTDVLDFIYFGALGVFVLVLCLFWILCSDLCLWFI